MINRKLLLFVLMTTFTICQNINDSTATQFKDLSLKIKDISIRMTNLTDSLLSNTTTVLRIKQQNSFNEAFLMARLSLGPNQKFEWNGKIYKTNYDGEQKTPPIVIAIDSCLLYTSPSPRD